VREQSLEDIKAIEDGLSIREMLDTRGWGLLAPLIQETMESIALKRTLSDDPYVIMACVRQEDGLRFVLESISELINLGDEAAKLNS